jgi:hypothetical protein
VDRIADEKEERKLVILAAHRKESETQDGAFVWSLSPLTLDLPSILFFSSRQNYL